MGPLVLTYPQGTHGLGPTNPRVISADLHTILDEFNSFQKPYGVKRITQQALYSSPQLNILMMWDPPHM